MLWLINLGFTDELLMYIMAGVSGLILILTVTMFIFSCFVKFTPGSSMDLYIGIGALGVCTAVILRGVSTDWLDQVGAEVLCQMHPAVLVVSWTLFLGGLMLKAVGIINHCLLFKNKKNSTGEWVPNLCMFLLTLVDAVGILIWIFLHEPGLTVMDAYLEELDIKPNRTVYECDGPYLGAWTMGAGIYHVVILGLTSVLVWPALIFSRSRITIPTLTSILLAVTVINALFAGAMGVLVTYLMLLEPNVAYAVFGGLQLWTVLFAILLLLIAKIFELRKPRGHDVEKEHDYDMPSYENGGMDTSPEPSVREPSVQETSGDVHETFQY